MKKSAKQKTGKKYSRNNKKNNTESNRFKLPAKTWGGFILRNILVGLLFFFVLNSIYNHTSGYKWVKNGLLSQNYNFINKHLNYTIDEKYRAKQGFFASYIQFLKKNTPDTAVILMPPDSIINAVDKKYRLGWLRSKRHVTYFLYPRKVVYRKYDIDSVYLKKLTHIAIVNSYGYNELPFNVKNKTDFTVIPVDPTNLK